jgi:hypothetical protein
MYQRRSCSPIILWILFLLVALRLVDAPFHSCIWSADAAPLHRSLLDRRHVRRYLDNAGMISQPTRGILPAHSVVHLDVQRCCPA